MKTERTMPRATLLYLLAGVITIILMWGCSPEKGATPQQKHFSVEEINDIGITDPRRALAMIDTVEERELMSGFDINRLRAMVYHNGLSDNIKSLEYALKAYRDPSARENFRSYLRLIGMISDQYYLNGNYQKSVEFCTKGIKLAQDSLVKESEANLTFDLGRNLMMLNRKEEGLKYYRKSVDILDGESRKDPSWETTDDYVYRLAILISTLRNEEYYDRAIELLPRYDEAVNRLAGKEGLPDGLLDMRQASGYSAAAHLYAIKGEMEKGRREYEKLLATDYAKTPDVGQLVIPYLAQIGDYKEALRQLEAEKRYWRANTDTVSYSYIQNHLESELLVYEELGDIRSANRVLHTIQELTDTLRERDSNAKALELAEIYKTTEQALQIERQSASITLRNVLITAAVILLVVSGIFIARILRFNRTVNAKNKALVKTIDELMVYKERVFKQEERILGLDPPCAPVTTETETAVVMNAETETETGEQPAADRLTEGDRICFERMNHEILARQLFLNPDFSKTSVMAEFGIPAYKFSAFFKEYAGCSFLQYIHNCRLDYAVRLMRENPSWTLQAIAETCRMSSSSFYSQFRKRFGMSPAEFRDSESANR